MEKRPPTSGRFRVPAAKRRSYGARLRAAGLRPVQIWAPDVRRPGFAEEARRQSLLVSASPGDKEALSFIEAAGDFGDEGDPGGE